MPHNEENTLQVTFEAPAELVRQFRSSHTQRGQKQDVLLGLFEDYMRSRKSFDPAPGEIQDGRSIALLNGAELLGLVEIIPEMEFFDFSEIIRNARELYITVYDLNEFLNQWEHARILVERFDADVHTRIIFVDRLSQGEELAKAISLLAAIPRWTPKRSTPGQFRIIQRDVNKFDELRGPSFDITTHDRTYTIPNHLFGELGHGLVFERLASIGDTLNNRINFESNLQWMRDFRKYGMFGAHYRNAFSFYDVGVDVTHLLWADEPTQL